MYKRGIISILFTMLLAFSFMGANGQTTSLRKDMATLSAYNTSRMPEKIFVSTDKWNYAKEDTIWFKTYVFDATLTSTTRSGLMYVEIVNAANEVVSRNMVSLSNGLGWGNIFLKADRYPEGTYT